MTKYEKKLEETNEKTLVTITPEDPISRDWLIDEFGSDRGIAIYELLFGKYREK